MRKLWRSSRNKAENKPDGETAEEQMASSEPAGYWHPRDNGLLPSALDAGDVDYSWYWAHDTSVKFWLPDQVHEHTELVAEELGLRRSEWLRQTFFRHLYGELEWLRCRNWLDEQRRRAQQQVQESDEPPIMFSRDGQTLEDTKRLGNSTHEERVHLSSRMRQDMEAAAARQELSLSRFARRRVFDQLYGVDATSEIEPAED